MPQQDTRLLLDSKVERAAGTGNESDREHVRILSLCRLVLLLGLITDVVVLAHESREELRKLLQFVLIHLSLEFDKLDCDFSRGTKVCDSGLIFDYLLRASTPIIARVSFPMEEVNFYKTVEDSGTSEEQVWYDSMNQEEILQFEKYSNCVLVREGQVQVALTNREPPLTDEALVEFCDGLDSKCLPVLVESYPYVLRTGAMVDLSHNRVGPRGIERLLDVLRMHGVPCAVLKAYRNVLDDSVIDPLVEYLHTQPASLPLQGLHISHNRISAKGAMRLVKALVECGHYPTRVNKRPFWLRLEQNEVERPEDIVQTSKQLRFKLRPEVKFTMCLMQQGLCSDSKCDHDNVAIQAPYFLAQNKTGFFDERDRIMTEIQASNPVDTRAMAQQSIYAQRSAIPPRPSIHMQFIEVSLEDFLSPLGFTLQYIEGQLPAVKSVDPFGEAASSGVRVGMVVRRANGIDVAMLRQNQTEELLRQRPLTLRFGFA